MRLFTPFWLASFSTLALLLSVHPAHDVYRSRSGLGIQTIFATSIYSREVVWRGPNHFVSGIEKGLVAYFSFNNCDARDDSGYGSYGQMLGNVRCWCGVEDDGLLLDGEGANITFTGPVNDYFTTSDFTISFYLKPEAQLIFPQSVISKRDACDDNHVLDIALDRRLNELTTEFKESDIKLFRELGPSLPQGAWLHYALVREGVYARTYINGHLVKEARRCSGVDISNDAPFSIGNSPCVRSGRMRRFKGVIDELRVYERALNDDEIQWLYEMNPIENAQMDCVS